MKHRKIAVVHDDFIQKGGAEKLIFEIIESLSQKDFEVVIHSSIISNYWIRKFSKLKNTSLKTSFLQSIPLVDRFSKFLFFTNLYSYAFESFDFSEYKFVFSSSTRYGHSIITKPGTLHISYINSPIKALWEPQKYFNLRKYLFAFSNFFLPSKRVIDFYSQNRFDIKIANSKNIQSKIKKNYQLKSDVLYPFVDFSKLKKYQVDSKRGDYYLIISRLVPWKGIDFVIEAFMQSGRKLVVVGEGDINYIKSLKSKSSKNIKFLGFVSEKIKYQLISKSLGVVFPQDEDFGLTIIESLYFGTPLIYFNKGGARELLNDTLGTKFGKQTKKSLNNCLIIHEKKDFSRSRLREEAHQYDKDTFINNLLKILDGKNI